MRDTTTMARRPTALERALPPLLLVAAALVVWHRALALFFSQDDFACLGRAAGLLPPLAGPWRLLSAQAFFQLMRPLAGLSPGPYHAASLAAHLACALILYARLSAVVGRAAALAGATFFAVHPALFTSIYWIAAITDPLAALFALLALLAWQAAGWRRWLAVPCFVLALLSKESAIPLPLVLLFRPRQGDDDRAPGGRWSGLRRRGSDPIWLALAALALADALYFVALDASSAPAAVRPYALSLGPDLWRNALTYLGWTANAWLPTVRGFPDAQDPSMWGWGLAALALWLAGCASRALRSRGWLAAGGWFGAFLLPYLPLGLHTYHYYLYLPLIGAAACVAMALDAALSRLSPRAAWAATVPLVGLLTVNGARLVLKIETFPFTAPGLYADPVVDRAHIARRVFESVRGQLPPGPVRLALWTLPLPGEAPGGYSERNLRSALYDGLALRVLLPQVVEVRFLSARQPLDGSWRWVLARPTGEARVLAPAELDSLVERFGAPR